MRESRGEYLKRKWHAWQQVNSEARGEMAKMETVGVEIENEIRAELGDEFLNNLRAGSNSVRQQVNDQRREQIGRRWHELNGRLDELRSLVVQPGAAVDFTARESIIEGELDEIEHELGVDYIERMRAERDNKTEGSSDNGRA